MKIFFTLLLIFPTSYVYSDFGDSMAHSIFQQKVDQLYQKAISCNPIEKDTKSSMDIKDWIKIQPALPRWSMLAEIEQTARDANHYAKTLVKKDKLRHCLAGCYVAKKLNYKSAVLVGWYKELVDASDCSKKTSFEKLDYLATIEGARVVNSKLTCEKLCKILQ